MAKTGKRFQKFVEDLKRHPQCEHGFYRYDKSWNEKTQQKAIDNGSIIKCEACSRESFWRYLKPKE